MNWVDFVVLAVLAVSALLAFMRGLVREVLGMGAWLGAALGAAWGLPLARPYVRQLIGDTPWLDPITFVGIFLILLLILMLIARFLGRIVRASPLGGLDRTLGLVFGLARGAALVVLAYIIGGMVVPVDHWPPAVLQSRLLPRVFEGAQWALQLVPDQFRPRLYAPPPGRQTSIDGLLRATPQGFALDRPGAAHPARN